MSEFTKGEWKVGLGHNCVHVLLGSQKIIIGLDKEACANASLIAAAPDMYEALEELIEIMKDVVADGEFYNIDSFTLQPAKTALAKAKGESE